MEQTHLLKRLLWFFVLFYLLLALGILSQSVDAEPIYEITDSQLNALTSELLLQKENNKQLLKQLEDGKLNLQKLMIQLNASGQKLTDYEQQLATLAEQLKSLQTESAALLIKLEKTKNLLAEAKQLYDKSVKMAQKEIRRLKWQRNIAIIVAIAKWLI